MLYKRCLNLSGEYMNPIKPDTLWNSPAWADCFWEEQNT